jgi:hypothetical protein
MMRNRWTLDVKKSNSSNETPNVMTVGVEKYGLRVFWQIFGKFWEVWSTNQ